ncbi:hypothetical protein Pmar_PMAR017924, partial [Perkinsus marinus ATCC 50983]
PNFSPHGYLIKISSSKKLSLVDYESGYGEIFSTVLPGNRTVTPRLAVGALSNAGGRI